MAGELLTTLRNTGEQLLDAELPAASELVPIVGALIAHLEAKVEGLASAEIDKLKLKAPPEAAPPAEAAPAPAEPVAGGETVEALRARLAAAEAAQAQAGAGAAEPTVATTEAPA